MPFDDNQTDSGTDKKTKKTTSKDEEISYKREAVTVDELKEKKFSNKERKEFKRKWREEKLISQMEKNKKQRLEKEEQEKREAEEATLTAQVGRLYTVSVALPGSILDNAQSMELRAYLAGQIARAAAVFNIDEIIIFDEMNKPSESESSGEFSGLKRPGQGNKQLFHILQYLECPQYLRKSFFPFHQDLAHAGLLNPLDTPHHLRESDISLYREGVTLKKPISGKKGSYANIGLQKEAILNMSVPPGQRVTVKMEEYDTDKKNLRCTVVSPNEPREKTGVYWGYTARTVSCLSEVFSTCPHTGGYDLTMGTSERGESAALVNLPTFKHALIVFGGLKGLEASVESDHNISTDDPSELFHHYLNVCVSQGSRTIRTEEALLIAMTTLTPKLRMANASKS